MVVIRLARGGSKNRPFYSIVATDKRNRRDSNFIERLGYFNPNAVESEQAMRIAQERITYWTTVGMIFDQTVKRLIKDHPAAVV